MTSHASWLATLGRGVKVVMLDSAYCPTPHVYPVAIRRFIKGGESTHASKVAQIIASMDPSQIGIAPACELHVGEVAGNLTAGWGSMCDAHDWAISLRADVVTMSFACTDSQQKADARLEALDAAGCLCLASYNSMLHWPHRLSSVISVGLEGHQVTCDIRSRGDSNVTVGGQREVFRGTSAACALVAGLAACAKSKDPDINRERFLSTCRAVEPGR